MDKNIDNYREIITSTKENQKMYEVIKNSVLSFIDDLNNVALNMQFTNEQAEKKDKCLKKLYYFKKLLSVLEKSIYDKKKVKPSKAKHDILDFIEWAGADSTGFKSDEVCGVTIDSRMVREKDVFFALQGENENGEKYIDKALENGASYVFASMDCDNKDKRIIRVENPLEALKKIAISYRKKVNCKVVGITGSVGKTSCKNLTYSILSQRYKVAMTRANYNTVTGISMSILDMDEDTEIMVVEMGVDTIGEMDELVELASPDYAVITNISESHLERFGSKKAIFDEKIKIVSKFKSNSVLLINGESEYLKDYKNSDFQIIKVYENKNLYEKSDDKVNSVLLKNVNISSIGTTFDLIHEDSSENFAIKLYGKHLAFNSILAIMVCGELSVPLDLARKGMLETKADVMRFTVADIDGYKIISDVYNSSSKSLTAAIETAKELNDGKLYVLMGDILEIGKDPKKEHAELGKKLGDMGIDYALFYGNLMREANKTYSGNNSKYFDDMDEAVSFILNNLDVNDTVLVKGSRAMHLEKAVDLILMNIMRASFVDTLLDFYALPS